MSFYGLYLNNPSVGSILLLYIERPCIGLDTRVYFLFYPKIKKMRVFLKKSVIFNLDLQYSGVCTDHMSSTTQWISFSSYIWKEHVLRAVQRENIFDICRKLKKKREIFKKV